MEKMILYTETLVKSAVLDRAKKRVYNNKTFFLYRGNKWTHLLFLQRS